MINPERVVHGVEFEQNFDVRALTVDEEIGFLSVSTSANAESRTLLGFGSAFDRVGGFVEGDVTNPILDLEELPPEYRTIDLQGKGVGPRMYNSPQAALGYTVLPNPINAYMFDIDPAKLYDLRSEEGSKISRIGRHAVRMAKTKLQGLESVVADIHAQYGDSEAVLMTQPPRAEMRQKQFDEPKPELPEALIIIRSAQQLTKVGSKRWQYRPSMFHLG